MSTLIKSRIFFIIFLLTSVFKIYAQELNVIYSLYSAGFNRPVDIKFTSNDRVFIVEQDGKIKIIENGANLATPFLDITSKVNSNGNEQGLLGLAFSPNYDVDGTFFVNYTNNSGNTVIESYKVSSNPYVADANSGVIRLTINQPYSNHNGGHLAFGQDGYLYIGTGDGGSGGDPNNNAQNGNSLLGKMLRIDVSDDSGYTIPADNPFVNDNTKLDEIWALGLRNPWRFSFDQQNGDLWIGDVGQNAIEEIDHITASESGLNFGWRCYEGNANYNTSGCGSSSNYTFPVAQYNQGGSPYRCAITGGYIYRSNAISQYNGLYFFSDYCSGELMAIDTNNANQMLVSNSNTNENISTFGQSPNGTIYFAGLYSGNIYVLTSPTNSTSDIYLADKIKLVPNPAKDLVEISNNDIVIKSASIYNVLGKMVLSISKIKDSKLDVSNLKKGIYFVKLSFSKRENLIIKKLIIQ